MNGGHTIGVACTQLLKALADDVVAGRLRVPITATYRLDDAAQAFTDYGAGALGKLAVSVS